MYRDGRGIRGRHSVRHHAGGVHRYFRSTILNVWRSIDAEIEALADEAERGYDPAELIARRNKRGRPTLGGAGPSTVESVRLDPDLNDQIAARAAKDGVTTSDVIREALHRYLHAS